MSLSQICLNFARSTENILFKIDLSQIQNKAKAWKILRARVYEHEREQKEKAMLMDRRDQIGSGDRSEKIRTYNYPQNRITDHRIGFSVHNIPQVVGEGDLQDLIDNLIRADELKRLSQSF